MRKKTRTDWGGKKESPNFELLMEQRGAMAQKWGAEIVLAGKEESKEKKGGAMLPERVGLWGRPAN